MTVQLKVLTHSSARATRTKTTQACPPSSSSYHCVHPLGQLRIVAKVGAYKGLQEAQRLAHPPAVRGLGHSGRPTASEPLTESTAAEAATPGK
jgi:hypothetical protein